MYKENWLGIGVIVGSLIALGSVILSERKNQAPIDFNPLESTYERDDYLDAESYRDFFDEIEKLMNETSDDWDMYSESGGEDRVIVTIEFDPRSPNFFEDI